MATAPRITPTISDRTVIWSYTAVGKRGGSVPDPAQDICSVGTDGTISEGADAMAGDSCEITARITVAGISADGRSGGGFDREGYIRFFELAEFSHHGYGGGQCGSLGQWGWSRVGSGGGQLHHQRDCGGL